MFYMVKLQKVNNKVSIKKKLKETKEKKTTHYENTPIQIYRIFHLQNIKLFRYKNADIFYLSAQNIDCWYSLELLYYIKLGFMGVKII